MRAKGPRTCKSYVNSEFVSFSREKEVALERMEPQGLKGKRCVLSAAVLDHSPL